MPIHWTATIIVIAGENLFFVKTVVTSAEAPGLCRSWRPPRPSPPAAAWRSPRGRRLLHNAAEWNLSTAGVGGTTCCGSGRLLSSRADAAPDVHGPRPSPGERRRPPRGRTAVAACSAASARLPRPRRVGRGSAGRGAGGPAPPPGRRLRAASAMSSSRRGEKCSRNEVPQFLWSLCFIFSKSKSATYGNYME